MSYVLDASIAACWILPDEQNARADVALELLTKETAWVPCLWHSETRNLLVMNERRGRVNESNVAAGLKFLTALPIHEDHDGSDEQTFDLARKHRLTFYDAAYLELAIRKAVSLATLDAALKVAAEAERVTLL